jgi:hypothetical protein
MNARVLFLGLLLGACSSSPATTDTGLPDRARSDEGGAPDRGGGERRDLRPDAPRPPARWATVPGASLGFYYHTVTPLLDGGALIAGGHTYDPGSGVSIYFAKAHRYDASKDQIVDAGLLKQARSAHSATRLADGRVLVVGGGDYSSYLLSSELFDPAKPASAAWSSGPDLLENRHAHDAILLPSGEVLVTGGGAEKLELATIVLYQPATNSWKLSLAMLKQARRGHLATLLPGGKVLISGGETGGGVSGTTYLDSLEVLDLTSGTSTLLTVKLSKPRSYHSATLLADGRVLFVGGTCGGCGKPMDLDDLYDPKSDTVTTLPHPSGGVTTHLAARLLDGRVLVAANDYGTSARVVALELTGAAPGWTTLPSMAQAHVSGSGAVLLDGTVLVVGGHDSVYPKPVYADKVERFFP